jgi:anti-sigma-K factor RskA
MNEKFDHDLDVLLKRHLESRLRPQLGRAAVAFRQEHGRGNRRAWWRWMSAGASLAASVVVAWALIGYRGTPPSTFVEVPKQTTTVDLVVSNEPTHIVESATWSAPVDGGLSMVNNQPVRTVRQKVVEEVEWFDPRTTRG